MGKVIQDLEVRNTNQLVSVTSITNTTIPEFNPLHQNIQDWLNVVDEFMFLYQWNDKTVCHLALNKLRSPAEVWYRGLNTHIFSWSEWKQMLRDNFRSKRNLHSLLRTMLDCSPKANQGLYEYLFEKLSKIISQ